MDPEIHIIMMKKNTMHPFYEVYSPQPARLKSHTKNLAARLPTLVGKTLAHVWDYQYRGNEIFPWIEEALKQQFPGIRFIHWKEFGSTHSNNERQVIENLSKKLKEFEVDAVISGIGA